jgi:hypothetical protein
MARAKKAAASILNAKKTLKSLLVKELRINIYILKFINRSTWNLLESQLI